MTCYSDIVTSGSEKVTLQHDGGTHQDPHVVLDIVVLIKCLLISLDKAETSANILL